MFEFFCFWKPLLLDFYTVDEGVQGTDVLLGTFEAE